MKKLIYVFFIAMLVSGCATMRRDWTREKLVKLELGMTRQQVVDLLGQPYRTETLQGKDKTFLTYYYWTDLKQADDAITDDELTPLVFDDDKLLGWGWSFLKDSAQKYEIRIR